MRFILAAASAAIVAMSLASPGAQSEKPQSDQPPRIRVDTNFVRVDAYPIKDGKPLLGLKAEDFEVFEDGKLQKIDTFEHVVVRPADSTERIDPSSQRASLQAAANPRNRVFVIFLDTSYVSIESGHAINEPLIRLMNRILGPDDLVGIMTPAMAASQVVLGRKTQVIEDGLRKNWAWGDRATFREDEREAAYHLCYPPLSYETGKSALAKEMIERKRERATLEALQDLVRYLRNIREERKAILTVTEGWVLYGENPGLMKLREDQRMQWKEDPPAPDPITVGPNGKLTTKDPRRMNDGVLTKNECDTDRMRLASMDNKQFMLDIIEDANYGNASFYPIDPRGLAAFDFPIGPDPPPPPHVDQAFLRRRGDVLETLAANTDGIAVRGNNDLDRGVKRISDDLTSYYLLGYYSSNTKLDGGFRSLKVRVKQPGVDVRARRGYRAPSATEVAAARRAADPPVPEAARAVQAAIATLDGIRPGARLRINAALGSASARTMWVAGELPSTAGRPDEFALGGTADVEAASGSTSASTRVTLKPGERTFLAVLTFSREIGGDLDVRARLTPADGTAPPVADGVRLSSGIRPLYFRRGPTTGNRWLPAADPRFSRTERVRVEIPTASEAIKATGARLLDRTGQPLQVQPGLAERVDDATGQRWITAELLLAPFGAGDYAIEIELTGGAATERVITAIRVAR
jgi:VWFA-related protein